MQYVHFATVYYCRHCTRLAIYARFGMFWEDAENDVTIWRHPALGYVSKPINNPANPDMV
jgi:hypothetical protein